MTDHAIDVAGLECRHGEHRAVDGIDLRVARGEVFALLGTNGAGKTTTLETLEGLRAAHAGRVRVLGLDPLADRALLRPRTGIMLQSGGFAGELTVAETAALWAALSSRDGDPEHDLERVALDHRRDVAVERLSGGERRRLELALAIHGDPELLFLDEPTTGLDPASRRRTWDVVRELVAAGATVLLTTHYLEEAEVLADHVAIMRAGRIAAAGTLADVAAGVAGTISFRHPGERDDVVIRTHALQDDLTELLARAAADGERLERLQAREGSLEDVFEAVEVAA